MRLKIYYVDDEPEILEIFEMLLEDLDVDVKTFVCPQEALRWIEKQPPDLLVLDQRLPGITGCQLAAKVSAAIPKILITGDLVVLHHELFMKVYSKPFCLKDLHNYISQFCAQKRDQRSAS